MSLLFAIGVVVLITWFLVAVVAGLVIAACIAVGNRPSELKRRRERTRSLR